MSNLAYDDESEFGAPKGGETAALQELRPVPRISIQAFCVSEGVAKPIERMAADRRMAKTHMKVMMGGVDTALEFYQSAPTPNLIILESASEPRGLLQQHVHARLRHGLAVHGGDVLRWCRQRHQQRDHGEGQGSARGRICQLHGQRTFSSG